MKYDSFKYLYPPRPLAKTKASELDNYEKSGEYIAMPKYNGAACLVFTNGKELHIYNRHKEPLSKWSADIDFKKLARTGNWFVYAGEYLNKGKVGEHGTKEKDKFVIWDVLVWDGEYLIGKTLRERLNLLEKHFPCKRSVIDEYGLGVYQHLCFTDMKGIFKAPAYLDHFKELYLELIQTDLYEGIVLKKLESKLAFGYNEKNNNDWQIKCRKETKNYKI